MGPRVSAETVLATYGTLIPGQVNHHQLQGLKGYWTTGTVRGRLFEEGWGAAHNCPGMVPDPQGQEIPVHLFHSDDLPQHWARLDTFEGAEYRREAITVATSNGPVEASIYRLADNS